MPSIPIVLVDTDFWTPLKGFLIEKLLENGFISKEDVENIVITDSIPDGVDLIRRTAIEKFGVEEVDSSCPLPRLNGSAVH